MRFNKNIYNVEEVYSYCNYRTHTIKLLTNMLKLLYFLKFKLTHFQ